MRFCNKKHGCVDKKGHSLEWRVKGGCCEGTTHWKRHTGGPIELRDGHFEVTEVVELTGTESRESRVGWFRVRQRVKDRRTRVVQEGNSIETGRDTIRRNRA